MIRDYVHHKPAPRYRRHRQVKARPNFSSLQVMTGAWGILACALFLFGFHFKSENSETAPVISRAPVLETAKPSPERPTAALPQKPRFDFYDLLTEKATKNITGSTHVAATTLGQALHVVELGYFKDTSELQAMASRLRMAGFEPQVTDSYSKRGAGRLFLGPYASEDGALSLKHALKEAGFKNTIVVEYSPS